MIDPTSEEAKIKLASFIAQNIADDFAIIHLSGNLARTIRIEKDKDSIKVVVPAQRYSTSMFKHKGVIIYEDGQGSYAEAVNKRGGFSKKHKGYVERSIEKGIQEWLSYLGIKAVSIDAE